MLEETPEFGGVLKEPTIDILINTPIKQVLGGTLLESERYYSSIDGMLFREAH